MENRKSRRELTRKYRKVTRRLQLKAKYAVFDGAGVFVKAIVPSSIHPLRNSAGRETGTCAIEIFMSGMIKERTKEERSQKRLAMKKLFLRIKR